MDGGDVKMDPESADESEDKEEPKEEADIRDIRYNLEPLFLTNHHQKIENYFDPVLSNLSFELYLNLMYWQLSPLKIWYVGRCFAPKATVDSMDWAASAKERPVGQRPESGDSQHHVGVRQRLLAK